MVTLVSVVPMGLSAPARVGVVTGAYVVAMAVGVTVSSAAAVPIATVLGGWSSSLAAWAAPAVLAVAVWVDPPTSGIDAADRLRTEYVAARWTASGRRSSRAVGHVPPLRAPFRRSGRDAERVGELIASIASPQPDLAAVLTTEPALADAHALAPRCPPAPPAAPPSAAGTTPAGPLPTAADGTDVESCADGACQILVTGPVDVPVGDSVLDVSLRERGGLIVGRPSEGGGYSEADLSGAGTASFGSCGGPTITVSLDGSNAEGAVLRIATEG